MSRLPLSIVTPERVAWEGEADSLVVPAHDGQLGILPGHAPLLAQLTPGVVEVRGDAGAKILAVSGGFVEVFQGRVAVFAETAEMAEEIDAERARQSAERAKLAFRGGPAEKAMEPEEALAALRRAAVRLKVADLYRRRAAGGPAHPSDQ